MFFTYQAVVPGGHVINENAEGKSREAVHDSLTRKGYEVVYINIDVRRTVSEFFKQKQIKRSVMVEFFTYLKGLMELGLNVTSAMSTVKDSIDDVMLKGVIGQIEDMVSKGYSLSQAMGDTGAFPTLAIASVRAAEQSNRLEAVFNDLAQHFRQIDEVARSAKKAATYPLIAIVVLAGVMSMMLVVVVPQLKDVLPFPRPLPTRIMIQLSDYFGYVWWIPGALIGLAWLGLRQMTQAQKAVIVQRIYRLPYVGRVALNLELSTVFMNLAMLNGGGIPLLETLRLAATTASSPLIREKLEHIHDLAKSGGSLLDGFRDPIFPPVVVRSISHGEATGRYDKQFAGVANFLRDRTASELGFLATFIEPIIIVIGGGMLMMMALAIFMPIYGQLQNIGHK